MTEDCMNASETQTIVYIGGPSYVTASDFRITGIIVSVFPNFVFVKDFII